MNHYPEFIPKNMVIMFGFLAADSIFSGFMVLVCVTYNNSDFNTVKYLYFYGGFFPTFWSLTGLKM